jgi:hypothetical protein
MEQGGYPYEMLKINSTWASKVNPEQRTILSSQRILSNEGRLIEMQIGFGDVGVPQRSVA